MLKLHIKHYINIALKVFEIFFFSNKHTFYLNLYVFVEDIKIY